MTRSLKKPRAGNDDSSPRDCGTGEMKNLTFATFLSLCGNVERSVLRERSLVRPASYRQPVVTVVVEGRNREGCQTQSFTH